MTADTPAFWILLEILETALYFYLVCGLLPNIRDMGRKEKIILYTVFAVTVFLSGMKYRIGSAFSSLGFFLRNPSPYTGYLDRLQEKPVADQRACYGL